MNPTKHSFTQLPSSPDSPILTFHCLLKQKQRATFVVFRTLSCLYKTVLPSASRIVFPKTFRRQHIFTKAVLSSYRLWKDSAASQRQCSFTKTVQRAFEKIAQLYEANMALQRLGESYVGNICQRI